MNASTKRNDVSRRDFVKGALATGGAVAGAAALGSCRMDTTPASVPATWDKEADLVCVGYGGAGSVAAITASDLGSSVVILEKQPDDLPDDIRHTPSTRMCSGIYICPTDAVQAAEHLYACCWGTTPRDVCQAWAKYTVENTQWLEKMGGENLPKEVYLGKGEFPMLPGHESIEVRWFKGGGPALFKLFADHVSRRKNIEVVFSSPVKQLIKGGDGAVLGVMATSGGRPIAVKANKAVLLACGGFEWDEEMRLNFLRASPTYFYGNPGNTGDGIRMALSVGASLWHMNTISGRVIPKFPGVEPAMAGGTPDGFIFVDKHGRRFVKERPWVYHAFWLEVCGFDTERCEYPRIPCYSIFDETAHRRGAPVAMRNKGLLPDGTVQDFYTWSEDSVEEITKGWLLKGQTLEELARIIAKDEENGGRMNPGTLGATIEQYNRFCSARKDDAFGRDPETLLPVKDPPFYALKMYPGGPNTQGGPRRNARSQVLDAGGNPIPRLYAAGELGSIYGFLYPTGGGNIAELIAFGRIAGENAHAEQPWA